MLTYSDAWTTSGGAGKFGGGDTYSRVAGETATVLVNGANFSLIGTLDRHHGTASVTIDGRDAGEIDFKSNTRKTQQPVFVSPDLGEGVHEITVTVIGDGVVALDKLVVGSKLQ